MKNTLKLVGVECKDKIYFKNIDGYGISLKDIIVNGEKVKSTFQLNWYSTISIPETVQRYDKQESINKRYELIDEKFKCDDIPLVIPEEDFVYEEDDYEEVVFPKYAQYKSLYKYSEDVQPDILIDIKYEYETILTLDRISEPKKFNYPVYRKKN